MRWLPALLLSLTLPAMAGEPRFRPQWIATCKVGGTDFSVRFESRSGHADQDDQAVTLDWGRNRPIALPVEPALFVPARFTSDARNHCRDIGAFDWPNGKLLLLIARDDRPSDDQLVAIAIDAKTGRFVYDGGALGTIRQEVMLLRQSSGYRLLLERSWHVDPAGHGEFSAPDWMLLRETGSRLTRAWETDRK